MAIITGFDNTDSSSIGSKFYLGKITGQENIGSRDSDGNPIPYYSSGDIGTLQSSVILQKFDENEFKGPEVTPNVNWTNYLNQLTDTVAFITNSIGFTWTSALDDRQLEINFVTKILDDLWDDTVQVVLPNGVTIPGLFSQFYWSSVKNILSTHASPSFASLGNANDTKAALEDIQASKSFVEMPSSIDTRLFNEVTVQGDNNLYKLVNQAYGRDYDSAQRVFGKSFTDFDRIYSFILSQGKNIDLLLGQDASSTSKVFADFSTNSSYDNLTSGVIGNFNLITGLNLTGIKGFPTGYISGQYLQANETGLEFVPIDDPVFDFTGLTDTPSNITSVKFVRGNQAGDGLEFTGVKFLEDVDDRPSTPITSGYLQLTDQNTLVWNPVAPGGGDVTYNFTGSEYFTGLKDTPSGYELNKFLRSTHVGIEYADINDGLVSFTGLTDTPSSFAADKFLKINNAANAVEYVDIPSPSVDFTGLNDTPASYVNSSGKYLRINNAENSVEFIDISGEISSQEISWNSYLRRGDLPNASDHPGMFAYVSIDELGGNSGSAYIAHGNDWVQIFPTVPNFSFSGLVDTPASYIGSSGKFVKVSDDESGVEYANLPDPIVDFTGLTDTPSSFAGQSGKYLQVNAAENSIEFVNPLFSTGSFVGFGGATVLIGLETAQPQQGWNDRQITQLQGHSGIKNLSLSNNEITLPAGKYLINAEGGVFRSKQTRIGIEFTAGDYAGQRFESRSNYAGSIVGNDQGGARGSVKTAVQSQNQMTFKVVSFVGESQSATTFDYAQTDVTVLDLGGDRDVLSITGLFDTPTSYVGGSGKFLQVNDVEDGVQYSSLSGQISSQEIDWLVYSTISDLPSASEHHGMFAHVHSEGAAYMAHAGNWEKIYPVNASSLTFTGLSDTPNVYDNGKILQSTANGLEWVDMPAGGGGGSSSTTLPAGSVLQKVVSSFPDITSLSTVGTEIASMDITPKSSDSQLLCEITFLWQEQGTNGSQQQGKFYIDDVEFGSQWYNHISLTANRLQTSLRSIATISDTNTKTISHKLTLDSLDPSKIGSIVMSVTEIAQSDYTLAGGGGGGSSSTNIIFKSDITSMVTVVNSHTNVPYVPTTDTYSAWDSSDNVWVAPRDMTVIVNCTNKSPNAHQHLFGFIFLNSVATSNIKAEQSSIKGSTNTNHSSVNLSAVIELKAGDKVFNTVLIQGANASANLSQQIMTITELSGGTGGGATPQFSRAQVSSSSRIGHSEADVDLDASQLATDSENWIHTNTTRNTVGILVPEDGLYDVSFNIRPVTNNNNNWRDNVSFLHTALQIVKADGTNVLVQETRESKNTGNGATLNNHLYLDNLSLDQGDFLYLRCRVYSNNTSLSWAVDDNFSFLSVSKSAAGGSSSGGGEGSSTFAGLTDTPSTLTEGSGQYLKVSDDGQTIEYVDLPAGSIGGSSSGGRGNLDVLKNSLENFQHTLPDSIVVPWSSLGYETTFDLFAVRPASASTSPTANSNWDIYYTCGRGHTDGELMFTDDADGTLVQANAIIDQTPGGDFEAGTLTLKWLIDNGRAFYAGGTSDSGGGGSGGIGDSAEVISSSNFGSKIPDVILLHSNGTPDQPRSYHFFGIDNDPTENAILYKSNANKQVSFVNNSAGDFDATLTDTTHVRYAGDTTLQSIIDNGHAIYLGGGSSSTISAVNQIQENIDNIPLIGSGVQIPDAILIKDINATTTNGADSLTQLDFASWVNVHDANGNITSQNFAYETNNFVSKRWYIRFNSIDGSYSSHSEDQHVKKEFNSIQEYISNDRALYFGGGGGGSSTFSASSYQENILQDHISTDNDANLNDLHFTGLETGAYYKLGGQVRFVAGFDNAGTNMWLYAYQDSFATDNIVAALNNRAGGEADPVNATHTFNHIFQATGDLFFAAGGMNSSQDRYIYGDGSKFQTFVQLEKLGSSSNGDGGSSTFAGLTDTPSTLTEGSGQYLKVSDDGQTIEYVDLPAGGGSGGIGDSAEVINLSNFSGKIPDIIQFAASQGPVSYQFRYIQSNNLQFYDVGGNGERFRFNNDASGTFLDTNSSYSRYAGDTTLQSIIDNGHAIYLGGGGGGGGGSSTFAGLTDTPSTLTEGSGQYLKVSDDGQTIEYVDLPADGGIDSIDDVTDLPDNPADGQLITVGCDLYIGCNGEWVKVGANAVAPPSEAPACVSNLEEYNQYTEYKDQFLADNSNASFSAGLNNQTNIHDFIHDVCLFADSNLSQERNTVVIDETTYKWGMFASNQNINIRAQAFSDSNVGSCTFKEWRSNLPNFPKTNAQETIFIDQDASITGCFECTVAPSQPNCSEVDFHLQASSGGTVEDKSANNRTITNPNNAFIDNSETLFNESTFFFDSNKFLSFDSDDLAANDFTIEFWIKYDTGITVSTKDIITRSGGTSDATTEFSIVLNQDTLRFVNNLIVESTSTGMVSVLNNWTHIAMVRSGNSFHLYVNGQREIDTAMNGSVVSQSQTELGTQQVSFGGWTNNPKHIQDYRISKKAVYTNNFTPPTNLLANPCPDQPNCNQVALHLQPDTEETITDKSDNQHAVTTVGDTVVDNTATLFGGGTMNFDGNGDYLSIGDTSTFKFLHDGTTDYTLECWVRSEVQPGSITWYFNTYNSNNQAGILLEHYDTNGYVYAISTADFNFHAIIHTTAMYEVNEWVHIAVTFQVGIGLKMYINGTQATTFLSNLDGTIQRPANNNPQGVELTVAHSAAPQDFKGQIQDLRISKKVVYTNNFTPPAALLPTPC